MNEEKPIIAERIKLLRKEKGYTQEQLAELLGLNAKSSIANYESGANAPSDEIKTKMCEVFNCSMDYLMGESEYKNFEEFKSHFIESFESNLYKIDLNNAIIASSLHFVASVLVPEDKDKIKDFLEKEGSYSIENSTIKNFILTFPPEKQIKLEKVLTEIIDDINSYKRNRDNYSEFKEIIEHETNNIYMCPVYGRISAGQPNWAEECIEGRIPIDPDMMNIHNPEECFFLRVNGESMNKEIKNGGFALIKKTDFVDNGEIAVVLVNGFDATLKKFTKQGDLIILEPMSTDPSFETQVYDKNTEVKVIGKYIGKMEMK